MGDHLVLTSITEFTHKPKAMMDTPTTCIRVTSSIPIQTEDNPARQGSTSVSEYENLEFQITSV